MSRYENQGWGNADWMIAAVRRNPEALLLLGAGCAMLLRNGRDVSSRREQTSATRVRAGAERSRDYVGELKDSVADTAGAASEKASEAIQRAGEYASELKDRVSGTAGLASEHVQSLTDDVSRRSQAMMEGANSGLQQGFGWVLREQPLLVAATGLIVGAAAAAVFPRTEIEDQALSGAREAAIDAAQRASENLTQAAGKAGEVLQQRAAERGLTTEGLKDLTREVATTFKEAARGESTSSPEKSSPSTSPETSPHLAPSEIGR